jgi:hypothetical protein
MCAGGSNRLLWKCGTRKGFETSNAFERDNTFDLDGRGPVLVIKGCIKDNLLVIAMLPRENATQPGIYTRWLIARGRAGSAMVHSAIKL